MHQREFFSRHILPAHFVLFLFSFRFLFFFLPFFFFIFCTLSRKWKPALFVLTLRHLFYGLLAIQSQKLLNCWTSVSDISGQVFKSGWPFFFWFKCVKNCYRQSCKHMRNNSTRQKGKKNSTSQFQSFEHNGMKIYDQQRLESRE